MLERPKGLVRACAAARSASVRSSRSRAASAAADSSRTASRSPAPWSRYSAPTAASRAPAASDSSTSARSRSARTDASRSCVERRASAAALRRSSASARRSSSAPRSSGAIRARSATISPRELLRALGRGRLQRQRAQPLAHLVLDVARPLDLRRDARELQLGAVPAPLELAEAGRLLDERAPILGPRGEDGVDLALRDDRVHRAAEPDVGEQLDEVGAPHRRAVDEVLPLAAAHEAALDRDLAEVELLAEAAVLVVEDELDLAVLGRRPVAAAGEEDVVGLLGAHLGRRQRARRPDDRVGDVRLPRAVRSDHDRDPGLEGHLDRVGERLEAAQLDAPQVHARARLAVAADGDEPSS